MWNKSDRTTLLILMPLVISIAVSMDIYVPSIPDIGTYFKANPSTVQWTLSIFMFGAGIGQLFAGPLTDRFGRRLCALAGLIVYGIGTLICLIAPSIDILIAGRLLQSFGSCALVVVAYAIVRDIYSVEKGATVYSQLGSVTMVAPVLAPILGSFLSITFHTWRSSFAFLLIFAICAFIITYLFIHETLAEHKRIKINPNRLISNFITILKNKKFLSNSFITLSCLIALYIFCAASPFLLMTELHLNKLLYALCFGSNALSFIIASLLSSRISKRFNMSKTIICGVVVTLIGSLWMFIINYISGLSVLNFMLPMMSMSFGFGLSFGPATALALSDFGELAGAASALLTSIQFLGAGSIGSLILSIGSHSAIPFAILMIILSSFAFILIYFNNQVLVKA